MAGGPGPSRRARASLVLARLVTPPRAPRLPTLAAVQPQMAADRSSEIESLWCHSLGVRIRDRTSLHDIVRHVELPLPPKLRPKTASNGRRTPSLSTVPAADRIP